MKLPYPKSLDITPITVEMTNGINSDGEPNVDLVYEGKCRLVETTKTLRDADGKLIQLVAVAYIGCDIAPSKNLVSGSVTIFGNKFKIHNVSRPRNPDGSVHHTKLELM